MLHSFAFLQVSVCYIWYFSHASRVIDMLVWLKAQDGLKIRAPYTVAKAHRTVVQTLRFERTGSSLSQEKRHLRPFVVPYASLLLRSFQRIYYTGQTVIWFCTKNLPNEESNHVTLVRIAEEPIIPLLELNRRARNLIRT